MQKKYIVTIEPDDTLESPRTWDNFGLMEYAHSRYILGDEKFDPSAAGFSSWEEYDENLEYKGFLFLPLYIYDHGGVTMSCNAFGDIWDSGRVGTILVHRTKVLEEYGSKKLTKKAREWAYKLLRAEVEVFDLYLRGEAYGYIIEDEEGNHLDSCWGFYGEDEVNRAALEALEGVM